MKHMILATGWQLKERDPALPLAADFASAAGWLPASVPGTVHQDLLAAGHIPDPFVGLNELAVQWVGERDWLYRCRFDLSADVLEAGAVALCCDGLDTCATAWLNGQEILTSDNMFVPQRVPAGPLLHAGSNELCLLFEPALRHGKEREAIHGARQVWNGDASRVYIRKAQYHYGWDWGPCLLTAGPWRAVRLEAYSARIADLHCPIEIAADLGQATLPVSIVIEAGTSEPLALRLAIYDPAGQLIDTATLPIAGGAAHHTFTIDSPRLWWPRGHGEQPLYRLAATLLQDERELDQRELRLGMRRLQLRQDALADQPGTTFLFEINNTPIFCGGVNWIPADSFTPRITPERYHALLQLTADANMAMVRIWGGGIYEEDVFYDVCDELGLLVWQDFMFACGIYPAHAAFQASVRAEAEAAVRRLRHHPSIALWCGNNEDYLIAGSLGIYDSAEGGDLMAGRFPARAIYEQLLPAVCAALDPTRPYWPGSPYAGHDPNDPTTGDRHTWDVWHGRMAPYQDYPRFAGRFVSEFGMQALPDRATIESFAAPEERYPQSRTLDHRNKAGEGPRRLAVYVNDNVRMPGDLDGMIYATQLVQAEALAAAIKGWRRQWGGAGRYAVAGALIWQLNDCWPAISWAIIDYALRPKPAYYLVRRALAPLAVGLARTAGGAAIWAVNGTQAPVEAELILQAWTLKGALAAVEHRRFTLAPNQATELNSFSFDPTGMLVLGARLVIGGAVVARTTLWPEPFKYLTLPDPEIAIVRQDHDTLRIRAKRPAKGVWLSAGDHVVWSDNMLDLLPGDEQVIVARGLGESEVRVRWLE